MKVFFDTNVLIDTFSHRDEESKFSEQCFKLVAAQKVVGYINAKQLTDLYYILYKNTHDKYFCDETIKLLCELFTVVPFDKFNILNSLYKEFKDFEDGAIDDSAKLYCCNYFITRNIKHYRKTSNIALTPKKFLELFSVIHSQN